jgi:flagellar basal body rod protein FlgF
VIIKGVSMKKFFFLCLLFVFCIFTSCNNNVLLDEYKLLHTDFENIYTYGYKSYFNPEKSTASFEINGDQGSLVCTEIPTHCAIAGKGFFKVKLDDGFGYTRNGNFVINGYGELMLGYPSYSLHERIYVPEFFLAETINIKRNGDIFVSVPKSRAELEEVYVGQLKIYSVPTNLLEHYQHGIYKLKAETDQERPITDSIIEHNFLEYSNVYRLPVLLRMYYILSKLDEKTIPSIEFKKDILKILIEATMKISSHEVGYSGSYYIETFTPFLRYDY